LVQYKQETKLPLESSCFEILDFKCSLLLRSRPELSGLHDVIGHVIIRFTTGHFLLEVLWNQAFISSAMVK